MNLVIDAAQPADNEALCALAEVPMDGNIRLSFGRRPDYFAGAAVQCSEPEVYVCRDLGRNLICGMFSVGWRNVFVNGQPQKVRYFCDLRIAPSYQKSRVLFQICRFLYTHNILENTYAQTIIFSGNANMLEVIRKQEKRLSDFIPQYHYAGPYTTYMLPFSRRKGKADAAIRQASPADIPLMQEFWDREAPKRHFAPVYDFSQLGTAHYPGLDPSHYYLITEGGQLAGMAGVWDQKPSKQTIIAGYSRTFSILRPLINAAAWLKNDIRLPKPGSALHYLCLHSVLVQDDDPQLLDRLLLAIDRDYCGRGYGYLLFGLDSRSKLNAAFTKRRSKRTIEGKFFLVNMKPTAPEEVQSPLFYLDTARI